MPVMKISRIEDGIDPQKAYPDGVILSVPSVASAALLANVSSLARMGSPVVLLGRCDHIDPRLLALAGAQCKLSEGIESAFLGMASLRTSANSTTLPANVSIGPYIPVAVAPSASALFKLANGQVLMTQRGSVLYAQLNDYTRPVHSNLAVSNYGQATPHYCLAKAAQSRSIRVLNWMPQSQPVSIHMWRERDKLIILAGNLEGNFCGGEPCSVPTDLTSRAFTMVVNLGLNSTQRQWLLNSRTGSGLRPRVVRAGPTGLLNVSIELSPLGSEVFELSALHTNSLENGDGKPFNLRARPPIKTDDGQVPVAPTHPVLPAPTDLQVEMLPVPVMGLSERVPRFSWVTQAPSHLRGLAQSAYRVTVARAGSPEEVFCAPVPLIYCTC
jgi:hypothetical protein